MFLYISATASSGKDSSDDLEELEKAKAALEAQLAAANISDEGWFGYIFSKNTSNEMKYEDFPYSKSKKFLWKKISQKNFS